VAITHTRNGSPARAGNASEIAKTINNRLQIVARNVDKRVFIRPSTLANYDLAELVEVNCRFRLLTQHYRFRIVPIEVI
jgi:hypothetical protein